MGLPLLPPAPMPRLAAGGAAEGGFARGGGLEDAAAALRLASSGEGLRGVARWGRWQGFRAVHFVEVGFVDAEATLAPSVAMPLTPTLSP
jgi:hypothetical protein